jgi:hypothetical protein
MTNGALIVEQASPPPLPPTTSFDPMRVGVVSWLAISAAKLKVGVQPPIFTGVRWMISGQLLRLARMATTSYWRLGRLRSPEGLG